MLLRAAREHGFDLAEAVIVGDSDTDLMAGRSAGTATILLRPNGGGQVAADAVSRDLEAAVRLILRGGQRLRRVNWQPPTERAVASANGRSSRRYRLARRRGSRASLCTHSNPSRCTCGDARRTIPAAIEMPPPQARYQASGRVRPEPLDEVLLPGEA